jgi:hypothetical protein
MRTIRRVIRGVRYDRFRTCFERTQRTDDQSPTIGPTSGWRFLARRDFPLIRKLGRAKRLWLGAGLMWCE